MTERGESIEVSARTVDDAVTEALRQLGLSRKEVEIDIVKEGGRSLLGLLREQAVVRVTAKSRPAREKKAPWWRAREKEAPTPPASEEKAPSQLAREKEAPTPPASEEEAPSPLAREEEAPTPASADELNQTARLGMETLQDLMRHMGVRGRVTQETVPLKSQTRDDSVLLDITGSDLALLIGRRGETLRDLQFLTCLIVSRRTQHWPNVVVDVEHYRARRERTLEDLARRMADRVRETAEPMALEPMPPNERRIVHLALSDASDVFTESTGEADKRKVVIYPAK
ncbi:MAG TPA: RNA-binding cell elongation regulator Jag/EloR [Anaerolineae bacterium]|nr:RNA-binding cell elongation regulator Jag/EloR [Anaerolineae bacterium]